MADRVSTSYSYLQTANNRMSGLASGMDIDSIVEKLMKAESAKMEKLQQQKQRYEWQRDAYRDIDLKLETFHKDIFDEYGLQKSLITKKVSVSDTSKVDVQADASAVGALNISSVSSIATSGTKLSTPITTQVINGSHKLSDFGINGNASSNGGGSFTINVEGNVKTINYTKDDTIDTFLSKLTDAGVKNATITSDGKLSVDKDSFTLNGDATSKAIFTGLGFEVSGDSLTGNFISKDISANLTTKLQDIGVASDGYITLNVVQQNGTMKETSIKYNKTDTIDTLVKSLNSSGAGVTTVFNNGQMSLTSNATGSVAGGSIQVITSSDGSKKDEGNLFQNLGLLSTPTGMIANGTNAKYIINGIEKESTSNEIKESGYTLTLKQTFNVANDPNYNGNVMISSTTDTDAMFEKINSFIELYNGLVESLNGPINEKKKYDYSPLTDAQKAEMSEKEIENWEEKAKQGLLRNDTIISNVLSGMRESLYSVNENTTSPYNALFNIGITTTKTYSDGGKIEIKDEARLREAIENDPEAVAKLFTDPDNGIVAKLRKAVDSGSKQIDEKAGKESFTENSYTIGKNLISLDDQIDNWKERLKKIEERYYSQFTRMEEAINKANSQSSIFMQ